MTMTMYVHKYMYFLLVMDSWNSNSGWFFTFTIRQISWTSKGKDNYIWLVNDFQLSFSKFLRRVKCSSLLWMLFEVSNYRINFFVRRHRCFIFCVYEFFSYSFPTKRDVNEWKPHDDLWGWRWITNKEKRIDHPTKTCEGKGFF
jgi:hypothetical protein